MQLYQTTVFVNCGDGCFTGLLDDDPIAEVDTFWVRAPDPVTAAEETFVVGQKEIRPDAYGKRYPLDVNSVSTGDVIRVIDDTGATTWWAVDRVGWREIVELANSRCLLRGSKRTARR